MNRYDLSAITAREFEILCDDIVSQMLEVEVKRGKPGPDGGIDGSFSVDRAKRGIVQAKHYMDTGFRGLLGKLKKEELQRAEQVGASRYILMTSCGLTEENRQEIFDLYHGMIMSLDDIHSGDDICALLGQPEYEHVVRKHYKLWLSGMDALERFCGDGNHDKSLAVLDEIKEDLRAAVQTEAFLRAGLKLQKDRVLIVTGQAGTGKTTLAKQLVEELVFGKGYTLVASDFDLDVFEQQLARYPDRKTLFYLDDFLGSNLVEALSGNRDAQIVHFMRRVHGKESCRLIMTSRSNIIGDAVRQCVKFSDAKVDEYAFSLSDSDLRRMDKANIVYSHLVRGSVPDDYKDCVFARENYFKIIDHRNFNPRIVSYCFQMRHSMGVGTGEVAVMRHVLGMLDNPSQIWRDCFVRMSDLELCLTVMVFLSRGCLEERLRSACLRLCESGTVGTSKWQSVDEVFENLCASVLSRTIMCSSSGLRKVSYSLFNPSVGDYILGTYGDRSALWRDLLLALEDVEVTVQTGRNGAWLKSSNAQYAKTCQSAFEGVLGSLTQSPKRFPVNFVLGVFVELSSYYCDEKLISGFAKKISKESLILDLKAEADTVIRFLDWCWRNEEDLLDGEVVTQEFLDGLLTQISDCERYLELKRLYDYFDLILPKAYVEGFKEHVDDWLSKLANDRSGSKEESEDDIRADVAATVADTFRDYEIPETLLVADDVVSDFDFSYWVAESDDGSAWQDIRERTELNRKEEDALIRNIFRR